MGKVTGISWTDSTWNPWWGCEKVSPACDLCYAETTAHRYGLEVWGKESPRRFFGNNHWQEPINWNRKATATGKRHKVFCASMADVFEDRRDLGEQRARLWKVIEATPMLDWLLLTKRPENINKMIPDAWTSAGGFPANVWPGTTVENQRRAEERIPELLDVCGALVYWLSVEPLLGPVDLGPWMTICDCAIPTLEGAGQHSPTCSIFRYNGNRIDWVIVGGESGHGCRPMELEWARALVAQCRTFGIVPFVKQLGGQPDKRKDPAEWPADLRVQEFPVGVK